MYMYMYIVIEDHLEFQVIHYLILQALDSNVHVHVYISDRDCMSHI